MTATMPLAVRFPTRYKSERTERDQSTEQPRTHPGEVILGLKGKQSQAEEDAERDKAAEG